VGEAVGQSRRLLEDRVRVLGPDHRDTLVTRNNLATWLAQSGQVGEAVGQFRQLLEDQARVLGPDHRETFITRINLAAWLARSHGRPESS
jgi:Tetratricopeptide repeat